MRLLSWNCRGLGNPCTVRELLLLIKEQDPAVLFLSKTRLDIIGVEILRVKIKFSGAFCVPQLHTGGGWAMLWNDKVMLNISTYSCNHIDADVVEKMTGKSFRVTGFYGNTETHKRKASWALPKHLSSSSNSPWVCMGDFNEIFDNRERLGRGWHPSWQMEDFRQAVVHCELHDLGFQGNPFTWRNKQKDEAFVMGRLDRVFALVPWISEFDGASVQHMAWQNSDHCPVLLSSLMSLRLGGIRRCSGLKPCGPKRRSAVR